MFIPFRSYSPSTITGISVTPGMVGNVQDMFPVTGGGFAAFPDIIDATNNHVISNALPGSATVMGYYLHKFTSSTSNAGYIHYAATGMHATDSKLYYLSPTGAASSSSTWVDASRTVGGAYSNSTTWVFTSFGNISIASNKLDTPQFVSGTTFPFADVTGMPKCSFVTATNDFVFIASTNEGTYGDQTDRWWCSAIGNYASWTPDIATQCVTNRIVDTPGNITGLIKFGDSIIIFKESSMYRADYVGPPNVWSISLISDSVGMNYNSSFGPCAMAEGRLFWINQSGYMYTLDSGFPRKVINIDGTDVYVGNTAIIMIPDQDRSCLSVCTTYTGSGGIVVYNYIDGRFAKGLSFGFVGHCRSGTLSQGVVTMPCAFRSDRKLYKYVPTGVSEALNWSYGNIETNFVGDSRGVKLLRSLRPVFRDAKQSPTNLVVEVYSTLSNSVDTDALTLTTLTLNATTGEFNGLVKFRWAKFVIQTSAPPGFSAAIEGIDVDIVPASNY